ncbi:zinc ribbon domain-containing protein [Anaerovorax odorimutans]|uniref:zinc ribbon domain-containing protein n=1 Tax=Anaerovorax odorimutans TaxID=109327 RepID=UPI0003FA25BC|nr:zinc ribbon domain-containing protein [Anaerovorax odorimutans]
MICPNCGNHLPDEARFCNSCGSNLIQSEMSNNNGEKESKNLKNHVFHRGHVSRSAAKIVAVIGVVGGIIALLWTPFIQHVLLSKSVGPDDLTGYHAEMDYKKADVNSSQFPNGKWVRDDGKAVIYISNIDNGEKFEFELFAKEDKEKDACKLMAQAIVGNNFQADDENKAIAEYSDFQNKENVESINFAALTKKEAIKITSDEGWKSNHQNQVTPDGTYYRIKKVWFWKKIKDGEWSEGFIPNDNNKENDPKTPNKEKEKKKDGGVAVNPPQIPEDGKVPKRVKGGGKYISEELMKRIAENGFYVKLDGVYYIIRTDVKDFDKFVNYYYYDAYKPDKDNLTGMQQGMQVAQARFESLQKMEHSCFGKTVWDFSCDVDFMPDFTGAQIETSGEYKTSVGLPQYKEYKVGYGWNNFQFKGTSKNCSYEIKWDPNNPYLINLVGEIKIPRAEKSNEVAEKAEYNLNIYFYKDGNIDAEGFFTVTGLGTEKIVFWLQMSAVEFQVDTSIDQYYDFKEAEYVYEFETLDDDVAEYSTERVEDYLENGEGYEYKRYQYLNQYQTVN